jgi:hypothetical protein
MIKRAPNTVITTVTGTHGLIRGERTHVLASGKIDDAEHLKPYKRPLVDITVSRSGLDTGCPTAIERSRLPGDLSPKRG